MLWNCQSSKQSIYHSCNQQTYQVNQLINEREHASTTQIKISIDRPINQSIKLQTYNLGKRIYMNIDFLCYADSISTNQ